MALGRAFIEVHADMGPFKRELRKEAVGLLRTLEKAAKAGGERVGRELAGGVKRTAGDVVTAADKAGKDAGSRVGRGLADGIKKTAKETANAAGKAGEEAGTKVGKGMADGIRRTAKETTDAAKAAAVGAGDALGDAVTKGGKKAAKEGAKAGAESASAFAKALASVINVAPPQVGAALVLLAAGIAVAFAPMIGSALAGAILSGVAIGAIAGGVALAFKHPRVSGAAKSLGKTVSDGLKDAAFVFVEPAIGAIAILERAFRRMLPAIRAIFSNTAPLLDSLVRGIAGFAEAVLPSLQRAAERSAPVVAALSRGLVELGVGLGKFIDQIGKDPGAAAAGLLFVIKLLVLNLAILGNSIQVTMAAFRLMAEFADAVLPSWLKQKLGLTDLINVLNTVPPAAAAAGASNQAMGGAFGEAANAGRDLTLSLNELFGATMTLQQAEIGLERAIDNITASFKENGLTLDISTEKGRQNRETVLAGVQAAIRMRDAQLAQGSGVEVANASYTRQIARLRATLSAAGLTKAQIDSLIGSYGRVPENVTTKVAASGIQGVVAQARALEALLNRLSGRRVQIGFEGGRRGVTEHAEGGVFSTPHLGMVAEAGREAIVPLTNPRRAAEVIQEAGLGSMSPTIIVMIGNEQLDSRMVRVAQDNTRNLARRLAGQPRTVL